MKPGAKIILLSAVLARINRRLAEQQVVMRKRRTRSLINPAGTFYVVDVRRKAEIDATTDIESYANEMGVLGPTERVG